MINPFSSKSKKKAQVNHANRAHTVLVNAVYNSKCKFVTAQIGNSLYEFKQDPKTGRIVISDFGSSGKRMSRDEFVKRITPHAKKWYIKERCRCSYDGETHNASTGAILVDTAPTTYTPGYTTEEPAGDVYRSPSHDAYMGRRDSDGDYIQVKGHMNRGHWVKPHSRRRRKK